MAPWPSPQSEASDEAEAVLDLIQISIDHTQIATPAPAVHDRTLPSIASHQFDISPLPAGEPETEDRNVDAAPGTSSLLPSQWIESGDSLVLFKVGAGTASKQFTLSRAIVQDCSENFRAALKPKWVASSRGMASISLPNEDPDLFEAFTAWIGRPERWLYLLVRSSAGTDERQCERCHFSLQEWSETFLVELYVFADSYQIPGLQHSILETFLGYYYRMQRLPSVGAMQMALEHTPKNSPLVLMLLAFYVDAIRTGRRDRKPYERETESSVFSAIVIWYIRTENGTPPERRITDDDGLQRAVGEFHTLSLRVHRLCKFPGRPPCACTDVVPFSESLRSYTHEEQAD
ncbi:hypothetical protein LTR85_006766 [Meristemomyces frigidus]|nr:hypothetical protein LTR85_006766 [Meristemomyces frigidus]